MRNLSDKRLLVQMSTACIKFKQRRDVASYHVHNPLVPALDHPPFWPDHIFPFYSTVVLWVFSIVRRKNRQYLIYVIVLAAL